MEYHTDKRVRDHVYLPLLNCIAQRVHENGGVAVGDRGRAVNAIAMRISASKVA
jgi:hypothetical protein